MTTLLVAKQYIKSFIGKNEVYLRPLGKLTTALIALMLINSKIGYMTRLNNISVVLIAALMCSFMPANFIVIIAAVFVVAHLYAITIECAIVALAIFLLMFLLYFRFSPKDTFVVLLTPICFILKIPYMMPIAMGLLGAPTSMVSVGCGVVVYYLVSYVSDYATTLAGLGAEDMAAKFRYIIDGILSNKEMLVTIAAFSVTIIVVYLIRRLPIVYAWFIATIAGALINIMILLVGDLIFDTQVSILGAMIGTVIAIGLTRIIEFFFFHVDYNRAESVQFEDDEYYYYVKAIPKITVAAPSRTVKKINSPKKRSAGGGPNRHH